LQFDDLNDSLDGKNANNNEASKKKKAAANN